MPYGSPYAAPVVSIPSSEMVTVFVPAGTVTGTSTAALPWLTIVTRPSSWYASTFAVRLAACRRCCWAIAVNVGFCQRRGRGERGAVAGQRRVQYRVEHPVLGEVGLVRVVRGRVGRHDVVEGDPRLDRHDVVGEPARLGQRRDARRRGRVVLADAAAAVGPARVDPVVLVDLFGRRTDVVVDVHRPALLGDGRADRPGRRLARGVGRDHLDAVGAQGRREVRVVDAHLRQRLEAGVLAGHQLARGDADSLAAGPVDVLLDLGADVGLGHPLGAAVGVLRALPRHDREVLHAARGTGASRCG